MKVRIDDIAFGGDGVGRAEDGRAVFVPFVARGEEVVARPLRTHRRYVQAALGRVETPSAQRVAAPCPYFGRCGGCRYQHLAYPEQLAVKEHQVVALLRRVGRLPEPLPLRPIRPAPAPYGYRNRITVHARDGAVGFFAHPTGDPAAAGAGKPVDVAACLLATPAVNQALADLRVRHHRRAGGRGAGGGGEPPREGHFTLRAAAAQPRYFQQTNDAVATELRGLVREHVAAAGPAGPAAVGPGASGEPADAGWHLVDAYCGSGFFSRDLRDRFAAVTGIEWDAHAVAAARAGAAPHERYLAGDVAELLPAVLAGVPAERTWLLVDPPEEGLAPAVVAAVRRFRPAAFLYVSCQPATLARDLGRLLGTLGDAPDPGADPGGAAAAGPAPYRLVSLTPLDMFPQTAEIEVVAWLERAREDAAAPPASRPGRSAGAPRLS